jgi:hypothetical protein
MLVVPLPAPDDPEEQARRRNLSQIETSICLVCEPNSAAEDEDERSQTLEASYNDFCISLVR